MHGVVVYIACNVDIVFYRGMVHGEISFYSINWENCSVLHPLAPLFVMSHAPTVLFKLNVCQEDMTMSI